MYRSIYYFENNVWLKPATQSRNINPVKSYASWSCLWEWDKASELFQASNMWTIALHINCHFCIIF